MVMPLMCAFPISHSLFSVSGISGQLDELSMLRSSMRRAGQLLQRYRHTRFSPIGYYLEPEALLMFARVVRGGVRRFGGFILF